MALSPGKFIGEKPIQTLWEKICEEFATERAEYEDNSFDDTASSVDTQISQYTSRRHTPVVYEKMVYKSHVDANPYADFDASVSHPAALGLSLLSRPKPPVTPPPEPLPDKKTSAPKDYLDAYIFPTLIPALIKMLEEAKKDRCFTRKRTKFNACDFITEYLYTNNPILPVNSEARNDISFLDIPFVKEWLKQHPRTPLPLSVLWSDEEASIKIQSFWKGYKTRSLPEVQELRQWQKEWREETKDVREKVNEFWSEQETAENKTA